MRRVMETMSALARAYGVDKEQLRTLWLAGRVRGQERPGRGRSGRTLWLRIEDVDRHLGGGPLPSEVV